MKIKFITEGGKGIGLGHITRCISINQACIEKKLDTLFIVNKSPYLRDIFRIYGIKYLMCNGYDRNFMLDQLDSTDVVIIDSYLLDDDFYYTAKKKVSLLVSIDDFNRINYPSGIVVNSSISAENFKFPNHKGIKYLLGPRFIPLRSDFHKVKANITRRDINKVFVSAGGFNIKFLESVISFLLTNFNFSIVAICWDRKNIRLKNLERVYIKYKATGKEIKNLMLKSDLAISGGGQTTYELARLGIPAIGICLAKNQEQNLYGLKNRGIFEYAGWYCDRDIFGRLHNILEQLKEKKIREEMSKKGKRLVDGLGSYRIVKEILAYERN